MRPRPYAALMPASMQSVPNRTVASCDSFLDRVKVATFMGTDRPHVLRQAIHRCRNFGTVSIVGVYGGFLDRIPMRSAIYWPFLPHGPNAGTALPGEAPETYQGRPD
jgi:hypothetical protein